MISTSLAARTAPQSSLRLPSPTQFPAYARAVNALPVLSQEQETLLAKAWRDHGDRNAAAQLVLAHLRQVVKVVRDHAGYGLPQADLAQEGTVGLMQAVHRFDPDRGVRLASFASHWILAAVREYIARNWRMVRLGTSSAMKKLFFGYRSAVAGLRAYGVDRDSSGFVADVAKAMELSSEQVESARAYFSSRDLSMDAQVPGAPGASMIHAGFSDVHSGGANLGATGSTPVGQTNGDRLGDPSPTPEESLIDADFASHATTALRKALVRLSCRDREILTARRLLDKPQGLVELGLKHGISAERVRQIENRAIRQLRTDMLSSATPPDTKPPGTKPPDTTLQNGVKVPPKTEPTFSKPTVCTPLVSLI